MRQEMLVALGEEEPVGLKKEDAISIERQPRKSGGRRLVYVFICTFPECTRTIEIRSGEVENSKGLCGCHTHVKRPFESLYNALFNDHRNTEVRLSFEDFIEFTKTKECHYCLSFIPWIPYSMIDGKYASRAYFLDRKDPEGVYSVDNCVVCCTRCNIVKSNRFTYEQFLEVGLLFRKWEGRQ